MYKIVAACLFLVTQFVFAETTRIEFGNYTFVKENTLLTKISNPKFGEWYGSRIELNRPAWDKTNTHTLQFEFETSNYFTDDNAGHFAIAVAANSSTSQLLGRGVIIGNVSGYGKRKAGCATYASGNRVILESFWRTGNCVWGDVSTSVRLVNNERYRLTVRTERTSADEPAKVMSYRLEQSIGGNWQEIGRAMIYDPNTIPLEGGWFILEVFSNKPWEMRLFNVVETIEQS